MNPVQEVRELISYGVNKITIRLDMLPKGWLIPVDLELISSGFVITESDTKMRIYKKLIKKSRGDTK